MIRRAGPTPGPGPSPGWNRANRSPVPALAVALLTVALLPVALLARLAGLAARLAGVREVPTRVLEVRGGGREVPVDLDAVLRGVEGLAQPLERRLRTRRVALGHARHRVAERLPRGPIGLVRLALELGEIPCRGVALLLGHRIELVAQVLQVVLGLLGVAARVRLRIARGGARQRPCERRQRGRPLLVRGVQLGTHLVLDRAELGQVHVEVVRVRPQPFRELAQLLGQARPRVVGVDALGPEVLRDVVDALRLPLRLLAHLPVQRDHRVLRVWQQHRRDEEQAGDQRDQRGPDREARAEQPGLDGPEAADGVAALAPHEAGLGRTELVALADHDRLVVVFAQPDPPCPASPGRTPTPTPARRRTRLRHPGRGRSRRSRDGRGRPAPAAPGGRRSGRRRRAGDPTRPGRRASRSPARSPRRPRPRARTRRAGPTAEATAAGDGRRARPAA